jgi:hypothetical protein
VTSRAEGAEVDGAVEAQESLGWRWPIQQALYELLPENEWTTWSDAIVLTEKVAETLDDEGYIVITKEAHDELLAAYVMQASR